jgi:hypothetical protein
MPTTTTLYRPVSQKELQLIEQSGFRKFPPRLAEQPIFYPVTNLEYARQITVEWNMPAYGNGYVTQFEVAAPTWRSFRWKTLASGTTMNFGVAAEELDEFNRHIVGPIEVVESYEK